MLIEPIRKRAESDLGIQIEYVIHDGMAALQQAVTAPDTFDIYDQWHTVDLVWTARAIQPIAVERLEGWQDIGPLSIHGRFDAFSAVGQGDNPSSQLYVQADGYLGAKQSSWVSMVPTLHNADAPAYLPAARQSLGVDEPESWAWLLSPKVSGKVGLMRDPSLGVIECALAAQAAGLAEFGDPSNLSVDEIDRLIEIFVGYKKRNHFRGIWSTYEDSVRLVDRGGVVLESIWSPAVTDLRSRGWDVRIINPREGYRGWHSGLCLSRAANDWQLDAAYDYMNWWLSGLAGAILACDGFYMSVPESVRTHLSVPEWEYWYEGLPASEDICNRDGQIVAKKGEERDGGSYHERMSRIAVWNSFMDEHNYLARRWNEFLAA